MSLPSLKVRSDQYKLLNARGNLLMNKLPAKGVSLLLLCGLVIASPLAHALQATANATLGVEFTDNATLVPNNEIDDQIAVAQVGGTLAETSGPVTGNADFSLRHQEYLDNTFGKRDYMKLGSELRWEQIKDRLTWQMQDFFTQTAVDSLSASVPSNRQNSNAFSLSTGVSFPVAPRHTLSISPAFRDYYYEKTDADNKQLSLSAGWFYQYRPTMKVSLNGALSHVDYDSDANNDYDSRNLSVALSGTTPRSNYRASIGATRVDRDALANNSGVSASLSWKFNVSSRSTLDTHLAQDITNSSDLFLGTAIDPTTGTVTNIQIAGEAVRNRVMRIGYTRKGTTVDTTIWTEVRNLDYSTATIDRKVQEFGGRLGYRVSPLISASLNASFLNTEELATGLEQDDLNVGAGLGFRLSRRLGLNFGVQHQSRDSDDPAREYDELSISANLGYKVWP
jgi:hypothetical protein